VIGVTLGDDQVLTLFHRRTRLQNSDTLPPLLSPNQIISRVSLFSKQMTRAQKSIFLRSFPEDSDKAKSPRGE
jgi:hypothetical protein